MTKPTLLDLFGTLEPPPRRQMLTAGGLSAVLEAGNLRTIRYQGVEVLRAISFLARDTGWGTYAPEISELAILSADSKFHVTYNARCEGPDGSCTYRMTILGSAAGRLTMEAVLQTEAAFPTNRTGFVLLHPAEVAGRALTVEDATAARRTIRFPDAIDPGTPATGIAAMEHAPTPGMLARVEMTGDLFEMEDQRNWADASFKTYVRPLAKPRPYVIPAGTTETQSVTLHITAMMPAPALRPDAGLPVLTIGVPLGVMPDLALFADRPEALSGDPDRIGPGIAQRLILRWRPGESLGLGQLLVSALAARCTVEAILPARDPVDEAALLMDALGGMACDTVLLAPEREFRTSAPGTVPQGEVAVDALVTALRRAGFDGRIVAGTPSFFPEFNRNPPGPAADAVYFGGCGIVHAADDVSVMETLTVYPAILTSAGLRSGQRPIWLGPCTLGARHAPYGEAVVSNPVARRIPMTGDDPRHGALFGAAYAVGLAAACAGFAVECLTLAAPFGPFGIVGPTGLRPLAAVQKVLAGAAGRPRRTIGAPGLAAIGWEQDGVRILVANTGMADCTLSLPAGSTARLLGPDATWSETTVAPLTLAPFRTALVYSPLPER